MQMQEPHYLPTLSVLRAGFSIFNITWEEEICECLPDPEFFARVFRVFLLVFWVFSSVLSFSMVIFCQFSKTFNIFGKNYVTLVESANICEQK